MTVDFASLPPEVNSGLIFGGPGPAELVVAANSWQSLAADLRGSASSVEALISTLAQDSWSGTSSEAMVTASGPYVEWLHLTAAQAEDSAAKIRLAVGAFETAQASSVHPALVIANRMQLASLVATNAFGQNSPAIAAVEAEYGEMWSQDVSAMLSYQTQAAGFATLAPLEDPPSLAGTAADLLPVAQSEAAATLTAASQVASDAPDVTLPSLQDVVAPAFTAAQTLASPVGSLMQPAMMLLSSGMQFGMQGANSATGAALPAEANWTSALMGSEAKLPATTGYSGTAASAALGEARLAGALSVPAGWAGAVAGIENGATASALSNLNATTGDALMTEQAAAAGGGTPMLPMAPSSAGATPLTRAMGGAVNLYTKSRPSVVPRTGV